MAVSSLAVPKRVIPQLRNMPRDIFDTSEGNAPGVGAIVTILLSETFSGVGLDLEVNNAAAAAGNATIRIDNTKVITLAPGARFGLDNVLYQKIEIFRAGAPAILVDAYFAGISWEIIRKLL